jgi:hypothetical protein
MPQDPSILPRLLAMNPVYGSWHRASASRQCGRRQNLFINNSHDSRELAGRAAGAG